MAENKTILELNEVTANASGDVFPLVQGGVIGELVELVYCT